MLLTYLCAYFVHRCYPQRILDRNSVAICYQVNAALNGYRQPNLSLNLAPTCLYHPLTFGRSFVFLAHRCVVREAGPRPPPAFSARTGSQRPHPRGIVLCPPAGINNNNSNIIIIIIIIYLFLLFFELLLQLVLWLLLQLQ